MNKLIRYIKCSLRREILAGSLFSLGIGVLVFLACYGASFLLLDHTINSKARMYEMEKQLTNELQDYIVTHQITSQSLNQLDEYEFSRKGEVFFRLYTGDRLVYTYVPNEKYGSDYQGLMDIYPTEGFSLPDQTVLLSDGTRINLALSYQMNYRPGIAAMYVSVFLGVIGFAICLYQLLRKKIHYIETMRAELDILAGGQLAYDVTVSGSDELSVLAVGINQMKDTIIRRQTAEEEARKANNGLVTAMAHDLRSPLTALIGYLEILQREKYSTKDQISRYTEQSMKKAFQIKEMSDKLFEYFLVYSADHDEQEMEVLPADGFLQEILNEFCWSLENKSFHIIRTDIHPDGSIIVNPELLKRIFDNMYSNLIKYADFASPIRICCKETDGDIQLCITNRISKDAARKEGSRIGLATCERIASFHNGSFFSQKTEDEFRCELRLPIRTDQEVRFPES